MNRNLLAQNIPPIGNPAVTGMTGKTPETVFGNFISGLVGVILILATIWTLFQLLQGGLEWISSGGDKTGVEHARDRLTNALLGLFIVFAAWTFYILILNFLGISPIGGGGGFQLRLPSLI
ncbi:hypothetical protein HZB96_02970 [Candidatus Gottesmanbacteria bacterium]|nr:hypothetical protein [Candidatus Gottesmanbacteria bacterium]